MKNSNKQELSLYCLSALLDDNSNKVSVYNIKDLGKGYEAFKMVDGIKEIVILQKCNCTELYIYGDYAQKNEVLDKWKRCSFNERKFNASYIKEYVGRNCIEHIIQTTSGLKSVVLGDNQVLGQVHEAYKIALAYGGTLPILSILFSYAKKYGNIIRKNTGIGIGNISVSRSAVDLLFSKNQKLNISILILGAGQVGSLVAKALRQKGYKNVSIANRTLKTADKLVRQGYAESAVDFKEALSSINNFEVIFFALSSVISESMAKKLEIRSGAILFDLGNPPNTSFFPKNKYSIYAVEHISKFTSFILEERKQKIITAQQLIKKYVKDTEIAINNKMVNASRNANLKRFEGEFSQSFIGKIKLKSQFLFLIRSFLIQKEFIEVQTPYVVAVSSDPVRSGGYNELFSVNWYSKKMYLRQSNQLHKQSLVLSGFDKIFELGPFWRAEVNPTLRHLSESLGLDIEMFNEKNLKVEDLIKFIGEMLGFVTKKLYESGLIKKEDILNPAPLIFEYTEICKVLKENNIEYEYGTDLGYDIEWKLSEIIQKQHGVDFFAVIHYPNTTQKTEESLLKHSIFFIGVGNCHPELSDRQI